MEIKIRPLTSWDDVHDAALATIGKTSKNSASDEWIRKMLIAPHSPKRLKEYYISCKDVPFFVITHITRHKIGVEFFVESARPDRNNKVPDRHEQRKDDLTNFSFKINAEALINISKRRLCYKAAVETREFWNNVKKTMKEVDPLMASVMLRECEWTNGICYEPDPCSCCQIHAEFKKGKLFFNNKNKDEKDSFEEWGDYFFNNSCI